MGGQCEYVSSRHYPLVYAGSNCGWGGGLSKFLFSNCKEMYRYFDKAIKKEGKIRTLNLPLVTKENSTKVVNGKSLGKKEGEMHLHWVLLNRQKVPVAVDCLELYDQHPHLLCCYHEAQVGLCIRLKAYHIVMGTQSCTFTGDCVHYGFNDSPAVAKAA